MRFTTTSGLPSNRVLDVVETADGTVWAATSSGLAWYDGYRWNPVGETNGLPQSSPWKVTAGPDGELVVVNDFRLYRGDTAGFREIPVEVENNPQLVGAAVPFTGNTVLIHAGGVLYTYVSDRLERYTEYPGYPDSTLSPYQDKHGGTWLAGHGGLYHWEEERWMSTATVPIFAGALAASDSAQELLNFGPLAANDRN